MTIISLMLGSSNIFLIKFLIFLNLNIIYLLFSLSSVSKVGSKIIKLDNSFNKKMRNIDKNIKSVY